MNPNKRKSILKRYLHIFTPGQLNINWANRYENNTCKFYAKTCKPMQKHDNPLNKHANPCKNLKILNKDNRK